MSTKQQHCLRTNDGQRRRQIFARPFNLTADWRRGRQWSVFLEFEPKPASINTELDKVCDGKGFLRKWHFDPGQEHVNKACCNLSCIGVSRSRKIPPKARTLGLWKRVSLLKLGVGRHSVVLLTTIFVTDHAAGNSQEIATTSARNFEQETEFSSQLFWRAVSRIKLVGRFVVLLSLGANEELRVRVWV